jgi:hypothetical protein
MPITYIKWAVGNLAVNSRVRNSTIVIGNVTSSQNQRQIKRKTTIKPKEKKKTLNNKQHKNKR